MLGLEYYLVAVVLLLLSALVVYTSLDRRFALRLPGASRGPSRGAQERDIASDILTRSVVRKVKVSKVGEYLIVTFVLRTAVDTGTEVEIEEPLVLLGDGEILPRAEEGAVG